MLIVETLLHRTYFSSNFIAQTKTVIVSTRFRYLEERKRNDFSSDGKVFFRIKRNERIPLVHNDFLLSPFFRSNFPEKRKSSSDSNNQSKTLHDCRNHPSNRKVLAIAFVSCFPFLCFPATFELCALVTANIFGFFSVNFV